MHTIPPGQARVLACFADAEDEGRQASRAEIAEFCGYAFPSAVSKHVDALVRKGLLSSDRDKKRNVRLTEQGWGSLGRSPAGLGVPVVGAIAAGSPILALENHDRYLDEIVPKPGRLALQVRGDSMIDAGINDGDYAVVDSHTPVDDGQIAAVVVDEEATLKVIHFNGDSIVLEPRNQAYTPLTVQRNSGRSVQVVGPLAFIVRKVD